MSAQASSPDHEPSPVRRDWKWAFRAKPKTPAPKPERDSVILDKTDRAHMLSLLLSAFRR
jgi:hypothetical protein